MGVAPKPRPLVDRFWEKVDKNGPVPEHCPELGPCWEWTGARSSGRASIGGGPGRSTRLSAAVVSYEIHVGPVPEGLQVNHHCDNTGCVAPSHIYAGTASDNARDRQRRGRAAFNLIPGDHHNAAKTHCPRGHPYDDENTYRYPDGRRACRACQRGRSEYV